MEFVIQTKDPFGILSASKNVLEYAQYVYFKPENLSQIVKRVKERLDQGLEPPEISFGTDADYIKNVQLIFIEDNVNFCFWAGKNEKKWTVWYPKGSEITGGWYSLKAAFQRALDQQIPILDAKFLSLISLQEVTSIFKGTNNTNIPLLEERTKILQEAGTILLKHFDGQFSNALKLVDNDAIQLVQLLLKYFPSFRDIEILDDAEIPFLKRAQICACDLSYLSQHSDMKNLEYLTAFADYKVPQMLRQFGLIEYKDTLCSKIDQYTEIKFQSREEIEIRAATVWGVELIRQHIENATAADIDNALWLISQHNQHESKPYHRTKTIYY